MNVYGLIGYPLEHSFSKKYFSKKISDENIAARFELYPLSSIEELALLISSTKNLKGLAVTIPYKVSVMSFLDRLTDNATEIGAVNCIEFSNGKLIGHNTDVIGFEKSLLPVLTSRQKGALILGNGGAAMAVKYVAEKIGLPYRFVTRNAVSHESEIRYDQINSQILSDYSIIINCTPVGMHPYENDMPSIPYHLLTADNVLYDLIYNPEETLFLKAGKAKGCIVKNGLEMLELQALENWNIWNNS